MNMGCRTAPIALDPMPTATHKTDVDAFLKIVPVGDEFGLIFPDELLTRLKVGLGDILYLSERPDGALWLTVNDPDLDQSREHAPINDRE